MHVKCWRKKIYIKNPITGGSAVQVSRFYWAFCPLGLESSVVRQPDSWSKGPGFGSPQDQRDNFLLLGQLSVLALISVSVPPPCYRSST